MWNGKITNFRPIFMRGRTAKTGAGRQGGGSWETIWWEMEDKVGEQIVKGENWRYGGRWEKGGWEMGDDTPLSTPLIYLFIYKFVYSVHLLHHELHVNCFIVNKHLLTFKIFHCSEIFTNIYNNRITWCCIEII